MAFLYDRLGAEIVANTETSLAQAGGGFVEGVRAARG